MSECCAVQGKREAYQAGGVDGGMAGTCLLALWPKLPAWNRHEEARCLSQLAL